MFSAQPENNVFKSFFTLALRITEAITGDALVACSSEITAFQKKAEVAVEQLKTDDPNSYPLVLNHCETKLIIFLKLLFDNKLMSLGGHVDRLSHQGLIKKLNASVILTNENTYPFISMMNYYLLILTEMLLLSGAEEGDQYSLLENAQDLIMSLYSYACVKNLMLYQESAPVSEALFNAICIGMNVLLTDSTPANDIEKFLYGMLHKKIEKLIVVREATEERDRLAIYLPRHNDDSQYAHRLIAQQVRDQLSQVDAILSRFNLSKFTHYREKYTVHIDQYHLQPKHLAPNVVNGPERIMVLSGLIQQGNEILQLSIATDLIYLYLDSCLTQFESLKILEGSDFTCGDIKKLLIYHFAMMKFDIRLLTAHASSFININPAADKIIKRLQLASRIVAIYNYEIDKEGSAFVNNAISTLRVEQIDFSDIKSEAIAYALGHLLQLKFEYYLKYAAHPSHRLYAIGVVVADLICLLAEERANTQLSDAERGFAKRIMMQYFTISLTYCMNESEFDLLTKHQVSSLIMDFTFDGKDENNKKIKSVFTYIYEIRYCYRLHRYNQKELNGQFFRRIPLASMNKLIESSRLKLINILNEEIRMEGSSFRYFLFYVTFMYAHLKHHNDIVVRDLAEMMLDRMDKYKQYVYDNALQHIKSVSPTKSSYRPVRMSEAQQLFMPEEMICSGDERPKIEKKKKKKKKNRNKNVRKIDITSNFDEVMQYFKNNLGGIKSFYSNELNNREERIRAYAILGLAKFLPLMDKKSKRDALGIRLSRMAKNLFEKPTSMIKKEFDQLQQQINELLLPWKDMSEPVMVVKLLPVSLPQLQVKTLSLAKVSKPKCNASIKLFSQPKLPARTTASVAPMVVIDAPIKPVDPFADIRLPHALTIKHSEAQAFMIKLLYENKMCPFLHGGCVLDTLFGIPFRDVDLLCFAKKSMLIALIEKQKNIREHRVNKTSNVLVVTFDTLLANGEYEQLEIAYLSDEVEDRTQLLKNLANQYGINWTLYYDPIQHTIIDPLDQFSRITVDRMMDVSQASVVDLNKYFAQCPERMLDVIYKIAKYAKNNVQLTLSKHVMQAMEQNKFLLLKIPAHKLTLLFDKLFLYGHALEAFDCLNKFFGMLKIVFPMLNDDHIEECRAACVAFDEEINKSNCYLRTNIQLELCQAKFISNLLFPYFASTVSYDAEDIAAFYIACIRCIEQSKFPVTNTVINHVQDIWQQRMSNGQDKGSTLTQKCL